MKELQFDNSNKLYYINAGILQGIFLSSSFNTGIQNKSSNLININNQPMVDINVGEYKNNNGKFNINNACNWLRINAHSKSQHACAKYVRLAIEAGFGDPNSTAGRPGWAWKYINYLPSIGFKFIDKVDNSYNGETGKYSPLAGDIAVYMKGNNQSVPGHICMYIGNQWVSDFKQNNMIVYQSTRQAYIFRYLS